MKSSDRLPSITASLLKDAIAQDQCNQADTQKKMESPEITASGMKKPAELDQDPGGGYNPNHVFPQE